MRFALAVLAASFALSASPEALGEAQLLPFGKFSARDGRPGPGRSWEVNDEQGKALAASLNSIAAKTPVVIDYEHQTLSAQAAGHKAPAAGWIRSAEWRQGEGLFAKVEWTAAAKAHIEAGEYLYISPVILYDASGVVTSVAMAALVNFPALLGMDAAKADALATALSGMAAPLNSPETHMDRTVLITALALAATATDADITNSIAALRARPTIPGALVTALGLPATADEATALSAVSALKAGGGETLQVVTALQGQVAALQTQLNDGKLTTLVDGAIAAGKFAPAHRDWLLAQGRANFDALSTAIGAAPVIPGLAGQSKSAGSENNGGGGEAALSAAEKLVAQQLGMDETAYAKSKKAA